MKTLIFTNLAGTEMGTFKVGLINPTDKRFQVFEVGDDISKGVTEVTNGLFFKLQDYSLYDFVARAQELNYTLTAYIQGSEGVGETPEVLTSATAVPVMTAGPDQGAVVGATATLAGSCSNYADNLVTYLWTKVSGTGGTITNPALKNSGLTGLSVGTYVFKLKVSVNTNPLVYAEDTVTITRAS